MNGTIDVTTIGLVLIGLSIMFVLALGFIPMDE